MCKYIIRAKGANDSVAFMETKDDLAEALAMAADNATRRNTVVEVFERISVCTPKVDVSWTGKSPAVEPARVADREGPGSAPGPTPAWKQSLVDRPY